MCKVKAIVGLGNPGTKYDATRHNAGFWFVEEVARCYGGQFRPEAKFHGELARVQVAGEDVWLLKPATYMNRSGLAVQALARFYKLAPETILVAHDELDLPVGSVRLKRGGGHGGHNGLKDLIKALGSRDFGRLRIGIDHPGDRNQVVDYVLKAPGKTERAAIDQAIDEATRWLPEIVSGNWAAAMNHLHAFKA